MKNMKAKQIKKNKRIQFLVKTITYILACAGLVSAITGMANANGSIITSAIFILIGACCMAPFYILWEHGVV